MLEHLRSYLHSSHILVIFPAFIQLTCSGIKVFLFNGIDLLPCEHFYMVFSLYGNDIPALYGNFGGWLRASTNTYISTLVIRPT